MIWVIEGMILNFLKVVFNCVLRVDLIVLMWIYWGC